MSATSTSPALAKAQRGTVYTLARQCAINEPVIGGKGATTYDVLTLMELRIAGMFYSPLTLTNAI